MKTCEYCGNENENECRTCERCGCETAQPDRVGDLDAGTLASCPAPVVLDLSTVEGAFELKDGFTRPVWPVIDKRLQEISSEEWNDACRDIGRQWVWMLREDLGGDYRVYESTHFLLLAEPEHGELNAFCESAWQCITEYLNQVAWPNYFEKHIVLMFSDADDYYQYISFYYCEGRHAQSSGVCICKDYVHVALLAQQHGQRRVLGHELAHASVAHSPFPAWLNEGLAMTLEALTIGSAPELITPEEIEEHRDFWDDVRIQQFWTGETFDDPDANRLSYALATALVGLLLTEPETRSAFCLQAHFSDAGQTAALDVFGVDLGEAVAAFTTAEKPRPDRRKLAEYFAQMQKRQREYPATQHPSVLKHGCE